MPCSAKAVANYFLELGDRDDIDISPMKIQKLVYYAHGWHLALNDESLIDEQIECWPYGPVIDSLFHEFKKYGSDPITSPAIKSKSIAGDPPTIKRTVPRIEPTPSGFLQEFLKDIWGIYGQYSAIKLSNMTHEPGSPWRRVYEKHNGYPPKGTDIPTPLIKLYFKALLESEG